MKLFKAVLLAAIVFQSSVHAADSPIELPSSVPVDVFKLKDNQRGYGYIGFNVTLELEDDFFNDKIGDIDYESQGFIYVTPGDGAKGFFGEMYEFSYTFGAVDGVISDPTFMNNGLSYDNTYDKDGFYIGIRPSYSHEISVSDDFVMKASTTLHAFFYSVSGSFSVDNGSNNYRFDEDNYGLALKPTFIFQGTLFPTNNFGLTLYGGLSTFLAVDWVFYDDGAFDDDNEVDFLTSGINPVFGYDISYRLDDGAVLNLSSIISKRENDESVETVIRYIHDF